MPIRQPTMVSALHLRALLLMKYTFWQFFGVFWLIAGGAIAQPYKPIPLVGGNEVKDVLSDKDIPTGQKGFARDY
jgi:hypothetical protein